MCGRNINKNCIFTKDIIWNHDSNCLPVSRTCIVFSRITGNKGTLDGTDCLHWRENNTSTKPGFVLVV